MAFDKQNRRLYKSGKAVAGTVNIGAGVAYLDDIADLRSRWEAKQIAAVPAFIIVRPRLVHICGIAQGTSHTHEHGV